jgi:hypothetical protein
VSTPGEGRALYIDESGVSDECVHLTAVSVHSAVVDRAYAVLDNFFERFVPFFNLSTDFELHGVDLARKKGVQTDTDYLPLHRREFLYRDALEVCADIETIRVYSVSWDWSPEPRKIPHHGGGPIYRERATYERLFNWIAEHDEPITNVTIDGIGNTVARRCYERYIKHARRHGNTLFLPDTPNLVSSAENRLIQIADLIAYAGYHALQQRAAVARRETAATAGHVVSDPQAEHDRWVGLLHDFYNQTIPHVAAPNGWYFAMRTYDGDPTPTRTHGAS